MGANRVTSAPGITEMQFLLVLAIDQSSGVLFHLEQLFPGLRRCRLAPSQGPQQSSRLTVCSQHAAVYQTGLTQADLNISEPAWPWWQNRFIYFGIYCIYCRVTFAQLSSCPRGSAFGRSRAVMLSGQAGKQHRETWSKAPPATARPLWLAGDSFPAP